MQLFRLSDTCVIECLAYYFNEDQRTTHMVSLNIDKREIIQLMSSYTGVCYSKLLTFTTNIVQFNQYCKDIFGAFRLGSYCFSCGQLPSFQRQWTQVLCLLYRFTMECSEAKEI